MLAAEINDITTHIPSNRSEISSESQRLLKELRSKLDSPVSVAEKELKSLSRLMETDEKIKKQVTQELQATIPSETPAGTVAQALYACIATSSRVDYCSPECATSLPLFGKKSCNTPTYMKTSKGISKINNVTGSDALVYTNEEFRSFTEKEEEDLRSDGVSNVTIFEREKGSTVFRSKDSISLSSHSNTRSTKSSSKKKSVSFSDEVDYCDNSSPAKSSSKSSSDSHCSPSSSSESSDLPKKCDSWNFPYVVLAVLLLLIVAIAVCFWWWGSLGTTSTTVTSVQTTPASTHLKWM